MRTRAYNGSPAMLTALALAALLLTPPGTPAGGFHWQRIITPPSGAATGQACVVLDAATFANAAPALRDLRLFQDGTELPYVIEESYDQRALNSGATPRDDRSEYEVVASAQALPVSSSSTAARDSREAHFLIDAHVPVERIRIQAEPGAVHVLQISASTVGQPEAGAAERVTETLPAEQQTVPFTLGANLQRKAELSIMVATASQQAERIFAEMRKRSLCYQPRSGSPLVLYLGGGQGMAAKVYGLTNGFSTALERPYATLGPLEPNPDQQHQGRHRISRLLIAAAVVLAALLLTLALALGVPGKEKSRPEAAHS